MTLDQTDQVGDALRSSRDGLSLDEVVEEIRRRRGDMIPVEEVGSLLRTLLSARPADTEGPERRLYNELEDLASFIQAAKAEIAALDPSEIREKYLPTATDELDAIIQSTEKATGEIMDACEGLDDLADGLDAGVGDKIHDNTMRIYEACSFQDLTGQRITKVVRMLASIEERVSGLVKAFEPHEGLTRGDAAQKAANHGRSTTRAVGDQSADEALLNGPQGDTVAMKQDDIDALLKSFD